MGSERSRAATGAQAWVALGSLIALLVACGDRPRSDAGIDGAIGDAGDANAASDAMPSDGAPPDVALPTTIREGRRVVAGSGSSCFVLRDDTVRCVGSGTMGQLGDGRGRNSDVLVEPVGLPPVAEITGDYATTVCARTRDGRVFCWGSNREGGVGNGRSANALTPVEIEIPGGERVRRISTWGSTYSCAITESGALYCWGRIFFSPPGSNTGAYEQHDTPTRIALDQPAVEVSAGSTHSCVVLRDGSVRCWGTQPNLGGAAGLGDGLTSNDGTPSRLPEQRGIVQAAVGYSVNCIRRIDGAVSCWGRNNSGEVGDGTYELRTTPVPVVGLDRVIDICATLSGVCAVRSDGTVWCWGTNRTGILGNSNTSSSAVPVRVEGLSNVRRVSTGWNHACAERNDGTFACWGYSGAGALANGMRTSYGIATTPIADLPPVEELAVGRSHACARTSDRRVFCWGRGIEGQIGDGTFTNRAHPVEVDHDAIRIEAGGSSTCAQHIDGRIVCWGYGMYGQIGDGMFRNTGHPDLPVQWVNGSHLFAIGGRTGCADDSDGTTRCWGGNEAGQLGSGAASERLANDATRLSLGALSSLSLTDSYVCATRASGTVACWGGFSIYGNDATIVPAPRDIVGVDNAVETRVGENGACARLPSGAVRCWGDDDSNGDGSARAADAFTPVDVLGIDNANALFAGQSMRCVSRADSSSSVWCWGYDLIGAFDWSQQYQPVEMPQLAGARDIGFGYQFGCALGADRGVRCWGDDLYGQRGDGAPSIVTGPLDVSL